MFNNSFDFVFLNILIIIITPSLIKEKEYLIKWTDCSPFEATWEQQTHLN